MFILLYKTFAYIQHSHAYKHTDHIMYRPRDAYDGYDAHKPQTLPTPSCNIESLVLYVRYGATQT